MSVCALQTKEKEGGRNQITALKGGYLAQIIILIISRRESLQIARVLDVFWVNKTSLCIIAIKKKRLCIAQS